MPNGRDDGGFLIETIRAIREIRVIRVPLVLIFVVDESPAAISTWR